MPVEDTDYRETDGPVSAAIFSVFCSYQPDAADTELVYIAPDNCPAFIDTHFAYLRRMAMLS